MIIANLRNPALNHSSAHNENRWMTVDKLACRLPSLHDWKTAKVQPTLKQWGDFACALQVPIDDFFPPLPPDESLPILGFRTLYGQGMLRPRPNRLGTLYARQERQGRYSEFSLASRMPGADLDGSLDDDYGDVQIAGSRFQASPVLYLLDATQYEVARLEWESEGHDDGAGDEEAAA